MKMTVKIDAAANKKQLLDALKTQDIINKIEVPARESFQEQTMKVVRTQKDLDRIKRKVRTALKKINQPDAPVEDYYQGYEVLHQVRTFFLGSLGVIDYMFAYDVNGQPALFPLTSKEFKKMLFTDKQLNGLTKTTDNKIRINSPARTKIKALFQAKVNKREYKIIYKDKVVAIKNDGQKDVFSFTKEFLPEVERQEKIFTYYFETQVIGNDRKLITVQADGGKNFHSVFSAVGRYAEEEHLAKRKYSAENKDSGWSELNSWNKGILTEVYKKAKEEFNGGKNSFYSKSPTHDYYVGGEDLRLIFNSVRKNTDDFLKGGDYLTTQIKSFIGSLPTLASCNTIKDRLTKVDSALNEDSLPVIKSRIAELMIKDKDTLQSIVAKQENQLVDVLNETLQNMVITDFGS